MTADYIIGIDLGTTNSALAYAPLGTETLQIELLPVPQLVAAGTVEARSLLPSFLYLAPEHEVAAGTLAVPWSKKRAFAVGEWARKQSADVPERTVGAAKSWLAYSKVDRRQPLLPWQAPADVAKVSPVTATQRYLEHLAGAWKEAFPKASFAHQKIVLTVPASFDASARELTREAALAAGFPEDFVLLEEPQAAVYAWLDDRGDQWRRQLHAGDVLLVCDVGGGTTDLTLIGVAEEAGELQLQRIAVGNHLLVGGDNMDLALAHHAAGLLAEKGTNLDPWQSVSLWHACRQAKETLLGDDAPPKHPVAVLGRGSRMIAKTVSVDLASDAVAELLTTGFFPACRVTDKPARQRVSGFQEIGLPFESDPAVTRHLAAFLQAHGGDGQPVRPTHVLFNGGVFKAPRFRTQLLDVLGGWFPGARPQPLAGTHDLDHAVARGATAYGWSKERGGVRIRGGTARSYYVGYEAAGLAIPGASRPLRALCVVPFGMEEGTEADVPHDGLGLVVGEPAHFRFFSSAVRKEDRPGDVLQRWTEEELSETDSLETTLPADAGEEDQYVPVRFHPKLTELGVLELWCQAAADRRWKLEFSVREDAESS